MDEDHGSDGHGDQVLTWKRRKRKTKAQDKGISV
jgi:hypothetical protein